MTHSVRSGLVLQPQRLKFGSENKSEEKASAGSAPSGSEASAASTKNKPVKKFDESIEKAHQAAMTAGETNYRDPKTGYKVLTESFLKSRGSCCQSGCRHCPYGFSL